MLKSFPNCRPCLLIWDCWRGKCILFASITLSCFFVSISVLLVSFAFVLDFFFYPVRVCFRLGLFYCFASIFVCLFVLE